MRIGLKSWNEPMNILLVIRELTRTAGAGRRQARVHEWNLGSVKAVGVELLCCVCVKIVFMTHLPTGSVHVTNEPEIVRKTRGMTLRSRREHRPREREDRKSLIVFQRSAVAADEDIERVALSRYICTVLAGLHE